MSIQRINDDNLEFFTIETNPSKSYSSRIAHDINGSRIYFTGSNGNIEYQLDNTGSVYLYAYRSPIEKETVPLGLSNRANFDDESFEQLRAGILQNTSTNIESSLVGYLDVVQNSSASLRKQHKLEILRFIPSFGFTSNTIRKNLVVNHLMEYYRVDSPNNNFAYGNFNSLNFWRSSSLDTQFSTPDDSVLLYPNKIANLESASYAPYGIPSGSAFSFEFWYKPSYKQENETDPVHAGTVFQLSGSYAVSIISGSSKDPYGRTDKFRVMLQLGDGNVTPPSETSLTANGVFLSNDDVLNYNTWNHVVITHGGTNYNNNSGSFFINGVEQGTFIYDNDGLGNYSGSAFTPYAMAVGNFYDGNAHSLRRFFNQTFSVRDGLIELDQTTDLPNNYSFAHPLQGEVHDIRIWDKYLSTNDIETLLTGSPTNLTNIKFNLPPFFTEESPYRQAVSNIGGVLVTPFFERNGTTTKPFAADMSFGAGGHYVNLENYVRDFTTGNYPRLLSLTGSAIEPGNSVVQSANDYLYTSGAAAGEVKKRLYTILPCDHGDYQPNFKLLQNTSGTLSGRFTNDLGNTNLGIVSLRNIVSAAADLTSRTITASGSDSSILNDILGVQPETSRLAGAPGQALTMMHRLRDNSSNQVVFFDISNMFYGKSIKPGSLVLTDPSLTGSDNKFGMVLRDDGIGNIYRADAIGSNCTWNSVGNIFYAEGLIVIKHPSLFFFGQDAFDISFKGEQSIHVRTINAYARVQELISSSNPGYERLSANPNLANEPDQDFVYITGINIHDENMNVVMKSTLAQPIVKRTGDKIAFKVKLDY